MSAEPSPYSVCLALNKSIEQDGLKSMLHGTAPQEFVMCKTDALHDYADMQNGEEKKNVQLLIDVLESVSGNFNIHWMTAGEKERRAAVIKIIQELKQIEVDK